MHNLFVVESRGQRVLTSAQIADCYDTTVDCIRQNFHANRSRFVEGKHYIALTGAELRTFKNEMRISHIDKKQEENEVRIPHSAESKAKYQFNTQFKYAKSLYLWTEKGALLHAKSLNTDKAWQVYDYLVDFYFRAKETLIENNNIQAKHISKKINIANDLPIIQAIQKVQKDLTCMDVLLEKCKTATWESKYNDDKYEVAEIATLITRDLCSLLELKANIIKEVTY